MPMKWCCWYFLSLSLSLAFFNFSSPIEMQAEEINRLMYTQSRIPTTHIECRAFNPFGLYGLAYSNVSKFVLTICIYLQNRSCIKLFLCYSNLNIDASIPHPKAKKRDEFWFPLSKSPNAFNFDANRTARKWEYSNRYIYSGASLADVVQSTTEIITLYYMRIPA